MSSSEEIKTASIALIGAGWWSQGWHLPHLHHHAERGIKIAAIVDAVPHPKSTLNPNLEPLETLANRYSCPTFLSIHELLESETGKSIDGVIICTPHATHCGVGKEFLEESIERQKQGQKGIHILLEKPMTTDVEEAKVLHDLVLKSQSLPRPGMFLVNHSANFRPQTRLAKDTVSAGTIGEIRHISAFFASPLSWIFDDESNIGWNRPDEKMLGNGFAWGQASHLLAWVYHVTNLKPCTVFCIMNHSPTTGADVSHSATIKCDHNVTLSLSGTSLLPGNAHSDPPVAKLIRIKIFGSKGAIIYSGNDRDAQSGRLELRLQNTGGKIEELHPELHFEHLDQDGPGPESLQNFLHACLGEESYCGADSYVGLRSVQTLDAMYRSHFSGNSEQVL